MDRPLYPNSPLALAYLSKPSVGKKYPWRSLQEGQSFLVAPNEANWTTISTSCYKWSKKLGVKFRAINHGKDGIEVARLPMGEV
jgi:hypothetical protein